MSVVEKLFESTATHGKPLFIAFLVTLFVLFVVLLAFARKCSKMSKSENERAPFKHWDEVFEDDAYWYALPAKAKLYDLNHSSVGTVASNLRYFVSDGSLDQIVEDYFYGIIENRTALWAKVLSIDASNPYITIESEIGYKFTIKKPNGFPLTINNPKKREQREQQ